jgi:acyl-[acyl-carrier-protein]-phospholipid O-acyltransferase/long-chain-fatty-acid--[acyl-carrier-protein] ligase
VPLLFVALGLFGIVAALFGPVKYGILPDQLSTAELSMGNALVEGATFMAILIGTIAGGLFVSGSTHMGWISLAWSVFRSPAGRLPRGSRRRFHRRPILRSPAIPGPRPCGLLKTLVCRTAAVGRHGDRVVVLAGRRGGAVAVARRDQGRRRRHRRRRHALSRGLRDRHRRGLAVRRASQSRAPQSRAGADRRHRHGIGRLDLAWAIGHASHGGDVDPMSFASSVDGVRMLADFFVFAFGGGCSWCRPLRRCRPGARRPSAPASSPPATCCRPPSWWSAALGVALLQGMRACGRLDLLRLCHRDLRHGLVRAENLGQGRRARFRRLLFRALFRVEVRGLENLPPPAPAC